jgi:hypothetical protein
MKRLIFLFFLGACPLIRAQVSVTIPDDGCPINTISTDPNNYQNSSDPTGTKNWNWMAEDFTVYYTQDGQGTTGFPATLRSPYFELVSNANTLHFVDQAEKDFSPANGWELLGRNFGSETQGLKNPYFMLYNRYTGVIRVFVNIKNTGNLTANIAAISLRFGDGKRRSAIFNQLGEATNAVNNFNKYARPIGTNEYVNSGVNDNYYWLWADFVSLYDPCTCGIESDLRLEVRLISDTQVTLSVNGTEKTLLDNTGSNNTFEEETIFKTIKQYADFGTALVTDVGGIFSDANSAFDKGTQLQADANEFVLNNGPLFGHQTASSIATQVGRLLFEVPKVNSWLKFASTLITVVKKIDGNINALSADEKLNKLQNTTVTTKHTNLKVTGNLIQSTNQADHFLSLPNSQMAGAAEFRKPVYNNVLGVFNLLEQPVVKLTKHNAPSPLLYVAGQGQSSYWEDNSVIDVFTPIYHVEVVKELTPVLNPASGLKIKSLESRLEFVNREPLQPKMKGLMVPGELALYDPFGFEDQTVADADRELYYLEHGYTLQLFSALTGPNNQWDKALMATPYLNQGCFTNTSLYTFSTVEDIVVKVKVILEPLVDNPNSDVDDIIMIFTYPAKIENANGVAYQIDGSINSNGTIMVYNEPVRTQPLGITIPGITYSPFMGMPSDPVFTNKIIDHSYTILGDLTIGPNTKYNPGTYTINVTGNIYFENTPIYNNVTNPINYDNYHITYRAGNEIIVSPSVIIGPETILEIVPSMALTCSYPLPVMQTNPAIKTYCSSTDYVTRSQALKSTEITEPEEEMTDEGKLRDAAFGFSLFPNPAMTSANIQLTGSDELAATIRVTDVAGKVVAVKVTEQAGNVYMLDLSNCGNGVYFVTVSTYGGSQTKQLIVL